MRDIANAVQRLNAGKAAGIGDTSPEMINYIGEEAIKLQHKISNNLLEAVKSL